MECMLENISLNYEVHGRGRPLLTLHGFYPDHRLMEGCLEPIFRTLSGWKRLYLDLPGMGSTKAQPWIVNSDHMLQVLLEFIDLIIPNQRFVLAGESYGGYLARGILRRRQPWIDGLLLLCPLIVPARERRDVPPHNVLVKDEAFMDTLAEGAREEFESVAVVQNQKAWERFHAEILPGLKAADSSFLARLQSGGYAFSFAVDPLLEPFTKPALFLMGRQDGIVGYRDAFRILEQYPRASYAVLDRAGHNLQIEQERLFAALVEEWAFRIEEEEEREAGRNEFRRKSNFHRGRRGQDESSNRHHGGNLRQALR